MFHKPLRSSGLKGSGLEIAPQRRNFVFLRLMVAAVMSSLLAWRKVPMASGGSLPCCTRWQTTDVKEVEDLPHLVRELTMWLSGTDVPQVVEVAEIGAPLPVESQLVFVERIKDGIAE